MKENSIERDIHLLESYAGMTHKMNDNQGRPKLDQAIEHILSDYKRVLKENEELKQDRNNNYQMIALAQNEALGYMQGYEDGKKLKKSAVACVVENQQYYIIKKENEHYKEYIEKLQKENVKLKEENEYNKLLLDTNKNFTIDKKNGNYKWNVIEIQKVKDNIKELDNVSYAEELEDIMNRKNYTITELVQYVLKQLLDGNDTNVGSI